MFTYQLKHLIKLYRKKLLEFFQSSEYKKQLSIFEKNPNQLNYDGLIQLYLQTFSNNQHKVIYKNRELQIIYNLDIYHIINNVNKYIYSLNQQIHYQEKKTLHSHSYSNYINNQIHLLTNASSIIPDDIGIHYYTTKLVIGNIHHEWNISIKMNENNYQTESRNILTIESNTSSSISSSSLPWSTGTGDRTILTYNGHYCQLIGFSLTTTQYIAGISPDYTYYNFSKKSVTQNVYDMANIIKTTFITFTDKEVLRAPLIRIPICADYWLYGSATSNCVQTFTGSQYIQAIVDICNVLWTEINNPYMCFCIDLHWNYAGGYGQAQASYHNGRDQPQNYNYPSDQQSMPLSTNTLAFWRSVCDYFGVDSNGNALNSQLGPSTIAIKQNTIFELYNEPYVDSQPETTNDYSSYYYHYINGYSGVATSGLDNGTAKTNQLYYYTGMGTMYCEIRVEKKAANLVNIAGSAGYAYLDTWNYYNYETHKLRTDSYNCFTELIGNIQNGTVVNPNTNTNYASNSNHISNITLGFHPYSGKNAGSYKCPGYNYYYTNNNSQYTIEDAPRLGDIMAALSTSGTNFTCRFPFLFTEFGQFDLPWGDYSSNLNPKATDFQYTNSSGQPTGSYPGGYYNKNGTFVYAPGCIGIIYDCDTYWASYSLWGGRPNNLNWAGSTDYTNANNYWSPYEPDIFTGYGSSTDSKKVMTLISSSNANLSGYRGPDFQYIWNNYIVNNWY